MVTKFCQKRSQIYIGQLEKETESILDLNLSRWLGSGCSLENAARAWLQSHVKPLKKFSERRDSMAAKEVTVQKSEDGNQPTTTTTTTTDLIKNNNNNNKENYQKSNQNYGNQLSLWQTANSEPKMSKSYSLSPTAVKAWKQFCEKLGLNESQALDRLIITCCESCNDQPNYNLLGDYLKSRIDEYLKTQEQSYRSHESLEDGEAEIEENNRYFNDLKKEWFRFEKQQKKKHIVYCSKKDLLEKLRNNVSLDEELIAEALKETSNKKLGKYRKGEVC